MKKTLLAVALTAASMTAIADVKLSGHTSYGIGDFSESNTAEDLSVNTAGASDSRFRMVFDTEANGVTYGGKLEFAFGSSNDGGNDDTGLTKRVSEVTVAGSLGKVSLGQGSTSLDGVSEASFTPAGMSRSLDAYSITDASTVGLYARGNFGGNNQDAGRQERLRYDSPSFSGLSFSASYDDNDQTETDAAAAGAGGNNTSYHARYAMDNFIVQVGKTSADADDADATSASITGKMNAFSAAVQYYSVEGGYGLSLDDLTQTRFIVGYTMGKYGFAVDYNVTEQDDLTGVSQTEAEAFGLAMSYAPTKGVELFAGVKQFEDNSDLTATNNAAVVSNLRADTSATAFVLGARVNF